MTLALIGSQATVNNTLSVNIQDTVDFLVPVEQQLHTLPTGCAQIRTERGVGSKSSHCIDKALYERLRTRWVNQNAGGLVDVVRRPSPALSHYRDSTGHGFKHHGASTFVDTR